MKLRVFACAACLALLTAPSGFAVRPEHGVFFRSTGILVTGRITRLIDKATKALCSGQMAPPVTA